MRLARLLFAVCCFIPASSYGERTAAPKPNLIVIMADDLGYADVGFNGCLDIPTPHIDSIASRGVKCTSGYVAYAVCGPSRAGFMTGRYPQRFGFERNPQYKIDDPQMGLPLSEQTIADVLKTVGYRSGIVGKWHLGANSVHHPLERGFDEFYGHLGGGHRYLPQDLTIQKSEQAKNELESYRTWIVNNRSPEKPTKYLTDDFSDAAVRFVENNHSHPFFLFLSYNAPHLPLQATDDYLARVSHIEDPKRRTYAAMISAVDDGVGRVLAKVHELGLDDRTIVFFLSDNGGPILKNASCNDPLRGGKGDVWEGGFRVPFAVSWPSHLPANTIYDQPVSALDIMATIVDLSGATVRSDFSLDGVNLVPFLSGDDLASPHKAIYLRKFDQQRFAVRRGDYKLVISIKDSKSKLYNLSNDIQEKNDLGFKNPKELAELDRLRQEWASQLIEPAFLGLIHTENYQKKREKKQKRQKK
ncbi:MAG: sulfatase-like hydrolase/transferase [Mariniblastus sp.]|nr:sulfatase-like hydrolase/transferase [Mariniblastus sp.]